MAALHTYRFIERFSADNMHNVKFHYKVFNPLENNLAHVKSSFSLKTKLNLGHLPVDAGSTNTPATSRMALRRSSLTPPSWKSHG